MKTCRQNSDLMDLLYWTTTNLSVVVETTEEGCVEDKQTTEQPLVQSELAHLAEDAVKSHLWFISSWPDNNWDPAMFRLRNWILNWELDPGQLEKWVLDDDSAVSPALGGEMLSFSCLCYFPSCHRFQCQLDFLPPDHRKWNRDKPVCCLSITNNK